MIKLTDTILINALIGNPHLRAHVEDGDIVLYDERGTWEGRATNAAGVIKLLHDAKDLPC